MKLDANEIPILDCSGLSDPLNKIQDTTEFQNFTNKLGEGMSSIGFVFLVNHGVHPSLIENIHQKSREFFELPREVKTKYKKVNAVEMFHGYTAAEDEVGNENDNEEKSPGDFKEAWDYWGREALDEANFPPEVPGFKEAFDNCRKALTELCKKLLRAFAVYLKLDDPDFFIKRHRAIDDQMIRSHNDMRCNYYSPMDLNKISEGTMRLTEHMDWGTITFLFQDMTGGLDTKKPNGEWTPINPIKDSIVLNAGLMLEMWSGGHFPATPHRVRLIADRAHKIRQSFAYFIQPDGDSNCIPLVPEKQNWNPTYPRVEKETHYEYFQERIKLSRSNKSEY